MNCGRSSSVEWKLPKLQRRVRFPSPAPPPPGRAPGGFVMAVRDARVQRGYDAPISTRGKAGAQRLHVVQTPHHFRWGGRHIAYETRRNVGWREKVRPAGGLQWLIREKTRPARAKTPNLGCFEHAGRTFSRFRAETVPQGELFRARHGNYSKSKHSRP